jgi:hypothetical protein
VSLYVWAAIAAVQRTSAASATTIRLRRRCIAVPSSETVRAGLSRQGRF